MLTEVKKTVHIVVDDIHATPDENLLARTIMAEGKTLDEYGDALMAAAKLRKAKAQYHVWTVHICFTRDCIFEPKIQESSIDEGLLEGFANCLAGAIRGQIDEKNERAVGAVLLKELRHAFENKVFAILPQSKGN